MIITILFKEFFMKYVLLIALMFAGSTVMAGDCANGSCRLRSRAVNVTKEVVSVPVEVTRNTVEVTRNGLRRVGSRVRSVVR